MKKTFVSKLCAILAVCMMLTIPVGVSALPDGITSYTPNFWGLTGIPAGWSGSAIAVGSWGQLTNATSSSSGVSGQLIYDSTVWSSIFEYTLTLDNWGWQDAQRANILFYYTDDSNYYYLSVGGSGTNTIQLKKKVGGVDSVIAAYNGSLQLRQYVVKITVDDNNNINVIATKAGVTTTLFEDVNDKTFTSGKIGVASVGSAIAEFSAFSVKSSVNVPEFAGVYQEDFTNPTTAWTSMIANFPITVTSGPTGKITSDWGGDRLLLLNTVTLTKNYVYSVDINGIGGDVGNEVRIPFNYTKPGDSPRYYFVKVQGGALAKNPTVLLCKYDNWAETTLATYSGVYVTDNTVRVRIAYEIGGYISVDLTKNGVTTKIFDRFQDTSAAPGKVAVATRGSGATFDNVRIEEEAVAVMNTSITNAAGLPVTSLVAEKGNVINVNASIKNNMILNNANGVFMLVLKDDKGIVRSVGTKTFSIAKGNVGAAPLAVTAKITLPSDTTSSYKLVGYFWSNAPSLQPFNQKKPLN